MYNAGLYGLIGGVIVGRLGHVVAYWPAYRTQLSEIFGFNTQAFLLWPGVIGGLAVAGWYIYRHRLPLVGVLDAFAPGALVGVAIASLGAFLAGRVPGAASSLPWAVEMWGVMRHPSQVYEAIASLAVGGLAAQSLRRGSRPGTPFLLAILGYGLSRWLLEPFREASPVIAGTGLRVPQVIGLALALGALWALTRPQASAVGATPAGATGNTADEDQPPLAL